MKVLHDIVLHVIVYICIHSQSLLISTLLSSACNIGAVSLASEEENRILHNGRIWFEEWTTLICFQTHVPLLVLPSSDWSGYCSEETSPSTCWKIGPVRYKKYLDLPTPDTTLTKWSIHLHTLQTVAINTTRWHAMALYHFKTYRTHSNLRPLRL